ncbi:MAG TPA: hypothetical protein VEW03_16095, partial [Longimicrobiaceae bacterium]|nr:hypothetical protein [Longimicrobiaceae bacterium]
MTKEDEGTGGSSGETSGGMLGRAIEVMQAEAYKDAPWLLQQLDKEQGTAYSLHLQRAYAPHGLDTALATAELLEPTDDFPMPKHSPSRLQDPWAYAAMRLLWIHVDRMAARRGDSLEAQPLLGTLPTGQLNARAIYVPETGETGILFDDEIRVMAYLLSKVVAEILTDPEKSDEDHVEIDLKRVYHPLRYAPRAVEWFGAMLDSYLYHGWIRILPSWVIGQTAHRLALILCTGFEHFVMGHEYGHLARRHLHGDFHPLLDGLPGVTEEVISRSQEVEADAYGLMIACDDAMRELGTPLPGFWGAYLACKAFG